MSHQMTPVTGFDEGEPRLQRGHRRVLEQLRHGDADWDVQLRRLPQELLGGRQQVDGPRPLARPRRTPALVVQDDVDRGRADGWKRHVSGSRPANSG
jgi:hypothetical protein